ncbi:MAG TPA: DUF4954 domain-containing protein, partial [Flavisolibacter sp.]|nr:DUF4954 domain-containing protein [Flavisolibacter sp.]
YPEQKLHHAFASLLEIHEIDKDGFSAGLFASILQQAINTKSWMTENIYDSRAKDYQSEFRKMVYDNDSEMESVVGKLDDNVFINQQRDELEAFKKQIEAIQAQFRLMQLQS